MNYKSFSFKSISSLFYLTVIICSVLQTNQTYGQDTDGDGIADTLDAQKDVPSGMVLNLDETADLNANGDGLKKEGIYNTGAYENLILPYTKKEVTALFSSGNQSLFGDLEVFNDGTYKYNSKSNKVNGIELDATHDDLPAGAIREELFSFTAENGFVFQILVSINGTNDPAVISKLDYIIEASKTSQIERGSGFIRVKDKDTNEAKLVAQETQGTHGKFTLTAEGAWNYESTESNHHLMAVGSESVKDDFTIKSFDGTERNVSITIAGSKNPEPVTADDGYGGTISFYEVPNQGKLILREEITENGPYFSPFNGWTQNGATNQQIFKLEKDQRYRFVMEGITLSDPEMQILGPLDIDNKRYSVIQQPELGTVTVNKHTGSWLYSANDGEPTQDDNSTFKIGVESNVPTSVPANSNLNRSRTKVGTENTAVEYLLEINGDSIPFKVSDNGTPTGNGISSEIGLDWEMSFEILPDINDGQTPYANYDIVNTKLNIHVASNGTSTTDQIANAINNAKKLDGGGNLIPISEDSEGNAINVFFDASAQEIIEISGINLTNNRMNRTKAGGLLYDSLAGNDNGDFMGDDAEIFFTPKTTGYYLLDFFGRGTGTDHNLDFLFGTFNIIAEQVPADTFITDAGPLIDVEPNGDTVKPQSSGGDAPTEDQVDASTVDYGIIDENYSFKNFTGKLDFDGDVDYIKVYLNVERWYEFEVGGEFPDTQIGLQKDGQDWAIGEENDNGNGLNGKLKYKPSEAGYYYLVISSGSPTYWPNYEGIGTGQYVVTGGGGPVVNWAWLTERGVPVAFSDIPSTDVPSGTDTTVTKSISDKFSGKIEVDGDKDWYKYSLEKGKIYRWILSKIDAPKPSLTLRDDTGEILEESSITNYSGAGNTDESTIVFIAPYTGDFFLEAYSNEDIDENQANVATGSFNLSAKELSDDFGGDVIYPDDDGWPGRTRSDGRSPWIPASYDFTDAGYLQAGKRVSGTFYAGSGEGTGAKDNRDFDFFGIDMLAQNNYSFNIFGTSEHSLGDDYARLVLFDSDGVLVEGDVTNGSLGLENITPVNDGYYYLRASSANDFNDLMGYTIYSNFFSDDYSDNRNTLGILTTNSPTSGNLDAKGDTDWIRVDVEAGKRYQFKIDLTDVNNSDYTAPLGSWLKLNGPQVPSNYWLQRSLSGIGSQENAYTREIGHTPAESYKFPALDADGVNSIGAIITYGDKDWIAADLNEGRVYQINVVGRPSNLNQALADPKFSIYGPDGQFIKNANNNAGVSSSHQGTKFKDAEMLFTATETGTFYFQVEAETTTPQASIIADGAKTDGATTINVDPMGDYLRVGTIINFSSGSTFTLSQEALVTQTTLTGTLSGNIADDEEAYYSVYVATADASDGDSTIQINPLSTVVDEGTTIIFANGSTFEVSEEAQKEATTLTGKLSGDISANESGYTFITGRYKIGMVELPTGIISQHYHGASENEQEIVIDWTPRYTAPYFVEIGTHWGAKGGYNISMAELDSLAANDTIGETKETATPYTFGEKITSVMDYGGDRDWYSVQMIPGESYKIELDGDTTLSYSRQSPLIRVYDEYGKPKGDLWKWKYDRKWGKPGGAYNDDAKSSTYVYSVPQNRFENDNEPRNFYLEASSNITGNIDFTVTHVLDDQKENMSTSGVIEVGGTASGTWEKHVDDGANEDLLWGTHGGDGDWFKTNLVAGNTYKIDIMTHHFHRPSIKLFTESGVYFRDNQKYIHGNHDTSVWIETIKDGHAQMTFTANRTGVFFIDAWNTKSWGIEEGGTGNIIYDLSVVHIADDVLSSMDTTQTLLSIKSDGEATDGATSINIDALVFQTNDSTGATNSNAMLDVGSVVNFAGGGTFTLSQKALNGHTTLNGSLTGNIADNEKGFSENQATLERKNDRDWFKVKLEEGSVYEFNLIGNSLKDPELRIRDSHGKQLFYNDHINGWWNPKITYTANETGVYYVDVAGIDAGSYRVKWSNTWTPPEPLDSNDPTKFVGSEVEVPSGQATEFLNNATEHTVGNFIQDEIKLENNRKWYKMNLQQTRAYRFEQYGDSMQAPSMFIRDQNGVPVFPPPKKDKARSTGEKLVLNYDAPSTGVYYLDAGGFWSDGYQLNDSGRISGVPIGTYTIKSYDLGEATERALSWDTNIDGVLNDDDTFDKATPTNINIGAQDTSGQIEYATFRDLYSASLTEGATYRFRVSGELVNGDVDRGVKTRLFLHDANGELLHTMTDADLDYKATNSGTYYIAVGATTGQVTGTNFRPNGVPYAYDLKLIQKRAPKTLPSASWLSELSVISSDIADAVISGNSDGKLDRAELIAILDKVKVGGITEAELTDLRILVANYKELGLTNYLVTILDNLANGDPANQYYTGRKDSNLGNTARQNIGNLYPGSSEQRVQRLINKWFRGLDSPATPKLYVYLDLPLFFNDARATDIRQGSLGDCYLLSSLSAVAESTIASIDGRYPSVYPGDMFIDNGDNTYGVRMYDNYGAERWVTVDKYVPGYRSTDLRNVSTVDGETWAMMAEKAYVQLNESDNIGQDGTNRYGIGNHFGIAGGSAVMALSHITGQEASYKFISEKTDDNGDFGKAWLIAQIEAKLPLVFSTSAPCPLASSKGVKRKHTYTYESYGVVEGNNETQAGRFFLRNPWGNTHANVTWEDLKELGSNVAYLDGSRTKMTRIDPTDSAFSASDAASGQGGSNDDSGLTVVETIGSTSLYYDNQQRLYAGSNANNAQKLSINGESIQLETAGRKATSVANINGTNQLLWKKTTTRAIQVMSFNSAWQFVSSGNEIDENANDYLTTQQSFDTGDQNNIVTLTVNTTGGGAANFIASHGQGATTTVTAIPAAGEVFTGWEGDASGSDNPLTITMNSDKTITAMFSAIPSFTLTVNASNGTVDYSDSHLQGATTTITATPAAGYVFTGWEGDASGSDNPLTITMNSDKTVTALFTDKPPFPTVTAFFDFEDHSGSSVADKGNNGLNASIVYPNEITIGGSGAPNGSSPTTGANFQGGFLNVTGADLSGIINDVDGQNSYTMSAWIKPSDLSGERFLFGQTEEGIHNGIGNGGFLHQAHWGDDTDGATDLSTLNGEWIHAAWVYNGATDVGTIYLNGVVDWSGDKRAPNGSGSLVIGARDGGGATYLGMVDDIAVWNEVLDSSQIAELAAGQSPINADSQGNTGQDPNDQVPSFLQYTVIGDSVTITGCDTSATGELVIPANIEGKPVTKIGFEAFKESSLTSISIPSSVTDISERAFYKSTSLTSISIPEGVTTIKKDTFFECTSLTSITIPNNVTIIGDWAFYRCTSLTSVTIPDSVISIGDGAFFNCLGITSIIFSGNAPEIGNDVFTNIGNDTKITVSANSQGYGETFGGLSIVVLGGPTPDTTAPVIIVTSGTDTVEQGSTWTDAGATADTGETVTALGTVDTSATGTYTITYTATDASGNSGSAIRTVTVVASSSGETQTLNLKEGWNLVSFYVEANDMTTANVLAPLQDRLLQVKNLTQSYDPSNPPFLNTLSSLNVKDGYWLNVSEDVSLDVQGQVPMGASISVKSGWNLVGYPRLNGEAVANELTSLGSTVLQIKDLESSYDPNNPPFLNTLSTMAPGSGYWLNVDADGTWEVGTVEESQFRSFGAVNPQSDHSPEKKTGPSWGQAIVYPNLGATVLAKVSIHGKPVAKGGVVAAFVGNELRGLQDVVLDNGISYVTLNINLTGAESVSYRLWNPEDHNEYLVSGTMLLELGSMYGKPELLELDAITVVGEPLQLFNITSEPFGFSFNSTVGRSYTVEVTRDLQRWKPVELFKGSGGVIRFTAKPTFGNKPKFFRIIVE